MRQPGDAERVVRAVGGDGEAFGELVAEYRDAVYGFCYHRVGHPEEARDLAQESFLRAYLDLRQLRDPVAFPVWLRRVAERVCATWQRRQRFEVVAPEETQEPSQERDLDLPIAIQHALAQLSDGARLAVTLYYINGYSTAEVGEFLGVPAGTVKSRLHHARRRLREELMDEYKDVLRESAPGPEFEGAVVRAVKSLAEARSLPLAQQYRRRALHGGPSSEEELSRYLVLEKDGSVLGECAYSRGILEIRGIELQIVRSAYTTGEGEWHDKGFDAYDRLASSALANAAEAGFVLAVAHEEIMCATRHGYAPCFHHHRISVPARHLMHGESAGTVRAFRQPDSAAVAGLRAIPRSRPTIWAWQNPDGDPPFVLERQDAVVGSYSIAPKRRNCPPVLINEMEGADMDAYRAMAKHCADAAVREGQHTVVTYLSPDHPLGALMLSHGGIAETEGPSWNVARDEDHICILDLAGALRAVAPGLAGLPAATVSIDMDGEVVTIRGCGPPQVEDRAPSGAQPARIGRVSMTQLFVGCCSVFDIQGRSDVELPVEAVDMLEALFPRTRPYAWPDPYVWNEDSLREDRPWAFEEPWLSRLAEHPRPWA